MILIYFILYNYQTSLSTDQRGLLYGQANSYSKLILRERRSSVVKTRSSKRIYRIVNAIFLLSLLILSTSQASSVSAGEVAKVDITYEVDYVSEVDAAPVFADVPESHWALNWIEHLYNAGITSGCGTNPLIYCPEQTVTRAQMAIFLERGMNSSIFTPPAGTGAIFADVPLSYWAVNWIEKLYTDGITAGCSTNPLIYCPDNPVTRSEMAIFLLRAKYGASYIPPGVGTTTGFNDVPFTHWAAVWIKQLAVEGITTGCGDGNYCPEDLVTRAQMAMFLVRTFNLPELYNLTIHAFHDYDGNGSQEEGELNLEGIVNITSAGTCTTGVDGKCEIEGVPAGSYNVSVTDDRNVEQYEKMRYILPSVSEVRTIAQGLSVKVVGNTEVNESLGHGYLTLPYSPELTIRHITYEDLNGNYFDNQVRDWRGVTKLRLYYDGNEDSVYDWHPGWDIGWGINAEKCNMPVYAAAPGKVSSLGPINENGGGSVRLTHQDDRMTDYAHLGEIIVFLTQQVVRGQYLGSTFCGWNEPHLHWELMGKTGEGRLQWDYWRVPICRDPLDPNSLDFLTTACNNQPYAAEYFK